MRVDVGTDQPGRARRAAVILVASITMIVGMLPIFAVGVLLPFVRADTGISAAWAGGLLSWLLVVAALTSGPIGRVVDRVGPRPVMIALFAAMAAAWTVASLAGHLAVAIAAVTVAGLGVAGCTPATTRLLFGMLEGAPLRLALSIAHSGSQLGAVLSGAVLPWIASVAGWRTSLRGVAGLALVGLVLTLTPILVGRIRRDADNPAASHSLIDTLQNTPGLMRIVVFVFVVNAGVNAFVAYVPSYATAAFSLDLATAGLTTSVMGAGATVGKMLWGTVPALAGGRGPLQLLAAVSATAMGFLLAAPFVGVWALWVGTALFGLSAPTWAVPTTREAGLRGGTLRSGTAAGAVMLAGFTGGAVTPVLLGWVIDVSTYAVGWISAVVLFVVAGIVITGLADRPETVDGAR